MRSCRVDHLDLNVPSGAPRLLPCSNWSYMPLLPAEPSSLLAMRSREASLAVVPGDGPPGGLANRLAALLGPSPSSCTFNTSSGCGCCFRKRRRRHSSPANAPATARAATTPTTAHTQPGVLPVLLVLAPSLLLSLLPMLDPLLARGGGAVLAGCGFEQETVVFLPEASTVPTARQPAQKRQDREQQGGQQDIQQQQV